MRAKRSLAVLSALGLVGLAAVSPAGAAGRVQTCQGPGVVTQAGQLTMSPGLNGRATKQKVAGKIRLTNCSPESVTTGSGSMRIEPIKTSAVTCALITSRHKLAVHATITWPNRKISVLTLTFSFTGANRRANLSGGVKSGLFAGHKVAGQLKYKPVISPHGRTVAQVCAGKAAPGESGRGAIFRLDLFKTKPFVIG